MLKSDTILNHATKCAFFKNNYNFPSAFFIKQMLQFKSSSIPPRNYGLVSSNKGPKSFFGIQVAIYHQKSAENALLFSLPDENPAFYIIHFGKRLFYSCCAVVEFPHKFSLCLFLCVHGKILSESWIYRIFSEYKMKSFFFGVFLGTIVRMLCE